MAIQESGEMYLETILLLSQKGGDVHAIDIVAHMGYSKPSVSRAMGLLKKEGCVTVDDTGAIHLTESGYAIASKILERHTLLTQLLMGLGVEERIAAEDACKIEHVISDTSFEAIKAYARNLGKAI
ncbi:MAG: metal-dependent transcriptional regulator [Faecousia sp.]